MWFSCLQYCLQGRRGWENTSTARLWGIEMKGNVAQPVRLFVTPRTIQSMGFSRPDYWNGLPCLSPGDFSNPGFEPRSPTLQADFLPTEPQEKPKITGVGSLSLLQQIFPIQESNRGLLHCRWILYQLSYLRSPRRKAFVPPRYK